MLQFNEDGLLPPNDYQLTINELKNSLLVVGPDDEVPWNQNKHLFLISTTYVASV